MKILYMDTCIARTARANGHFSIWMEVFKEYKEMRRCIKYIILKVY